MKTAEHQKHLDTRVAHNDCRECRADTERRFVSTAQWRYQHVHDYLGFIKPRLRAISAGENGASARIWLRDFRHALDRRINLKTGTVQSWRKLCDSYQERLANMRHVHDTSYLKDFARVGASALS